MISFVMMKALGRNSNLSSENNKIVYDCRKKAEVSNDSKKILNKWMFYVSCNPGNHLKKSFGTRVVIFLMKL